VGGQRRVLALPERSLRRGTSGLHGAEPRTVLNGFFRLQLAFGRGMRPREAGTRLAETLLAGKPGPSGFYPDRGRPVLSSPESYDKGARNSCGARPPVSSASIEGVRGLGCGTWDGGAATNTAVPAQSNNVCRGSMLQAYPRLCLRARLVNFVAGTAPSDLRQHPASWPNHPPGEIQGPLQRVVTAFEARD
jgi:hypothetical protein